MYLLGYDIGSSSVKAALIDAVTGKQIASAFSPESEMEISTPKAGWAEQHPDLWWKHLALATKNILSSAKINPTEIKAIGISYQMHGLVVVDKDQKVLRPAIIWCDSRAVEVGEKALKKLGENWCLENLLNSPGNFTASKLAWVKENEPEIYKQIYKCMLPGDYIAMHMTGELKTTVSGLSEGVFWNFKNKNSSSELLDALGINSNLIPDTTNTFGIQGKLLPTIANELGLAPNIPITYRGGDQPNNAFSLNVLNPGEVAATAGTSGVIYVVTDKPVYDKSSRVNTFVHVNHTKQDPRYGILLCVNGTGISNSWIRKTLSAFSSSPINYNDLNALAEKIPVGSDGLIYLPYGNGAERTLNNKNIHASFHGLDLNKHTTAHMLRAVQEGIVFALYYGFEIMNEMGVKTSVIKAGKANMFLSNVFANTFASLSNCKIELYNTDGAIGAARAAGVGAGIYRSTNDAFASFEKLSVINSDVDLRKQLLISYQNWKAILQTKLK